MHAIRLSLIAWIWKVLTQKMHEYTDPLHKHTCYIYTCTYSIFYTILWDILYSVVLLTDTKMSAHELCTPHRSGDFSGSWSTPTMNQWTCLLTASLTHQAQWLRRFLQLLPQVWTKTPQCKGEKRRWFRLLVLLPGSRRTRVAVKPSYSDTAADLPWVLSGL